MSATVSCIPHQDTRGIGQNRLSVYGVMLDRFSRARSIASNPRQAAQCVFVLTIFAAMGTMGRVGTLWPWHLIADPAPAIGNRGKCRCQPQRWRLPSEFISVRRCGHREFGLPRTDAEPGES